MYGFCDREKILSPASGIRPASPLKCELSVDPVITYSGVFDRPGIHPRHPSKARVFFLE